jgi:hypothetical protein
MEGYYWRFTDPAGGRCVIALCGVCRSPRGPWAVVALAAHPGGAVRWIDAPSAAADPDALGMAAWDGEATVLRGSARRVAVDLGPEARLEAVLEGRVEWPRRAFGALGPAHAVPALPQYWHPHLLGARVRGEARIGGETVDLDGFEAYSEKNWGAAFPGEWWWGHATLGPSAAIAFAGGGLAGPVAATAAVLRVGTDVVRFGAPSALVRASAGGGAWSVRARSPRWSLEVEGEGAGPPHVLPVPVPAERRSVLRSQHHLAGRVRVVARRGRRVVLREESALAGLEHGLPA